MLKIEALFNLLIVCCRDTKEEKHIAVKSIHESLCLESKKINFGFKAESNGVSI